MRLVQGKPAFTELKNWTGSEVHFKRIAPAPMCPGPNSKGAQGRALTRSDLPVVRLLGLAVEAQGRGRPDEVASRADQTVHLSKKHATCKDEQGNGRAVGVRKERQQMGSSFLADAR